MAKKWFQKQYSDFFDSNSPFSKFIHTNGASESEPASKEHMSFRVTFLSQYEMHKSAILYTSDGTTITVEAQYFINITKTRTKFFSRLH